MKCGIYTDGKYFCTEWWLWTVCILLNIMLSQYGQYLQEAKAKVKIRIRTILDETKKKLEDDHCVLHVYLSVLCAHSQYLPAQSNVNLLDLLLGISTSNQGCHFLRWILKGHLKMLPILWASYPLAGAAELRAHECKNPITFILEPGFTKYLEDPSVSIWVWTPAHGGPAIQHYGSEPGRDVL